MASGSFTSKKSYEGRKFKFSWESTIVEPGKSKVSWKLSATGGSNSYYYSSYTLKINGNTVGSQGWSKTYTGTKKSGSFTVSHNTNGDASFKVSLTAAIYNKSSGTTTKTYGLDKSYPYTACVMTSCSASLENSGSITGFLNNIVIPGKARVKLSFYGAGGSNVGIASYNIYKSVNGGSYTTIATGVSGNSYTWDIPSSAVPGDTYKFAVSANPTVTGYGSGLLAAALIVIINKKPTNSQVSTIGLVPIGGGNLKIDFIGGSTNDSSQTLTHLYRLGTGTWQSTTSNSINIYLNTNTNFQWKNSDGLEETEVSSIPVGLNGEPILTSVAMCENFEVVNGGIYLTSYNYINKFNNITVSKNNVLWKTETYTINFKSSDLSTTYFTEKTTNIKDIFSIISNTLNKMSEGILFKIEIVGNNGFNNTSPIYITCNGSQIFCRPKTPNANLLLNEIYPCDGDGRKIEVEGSSYENYFYDYVHFDTNLADNIPAGYKKIKLIPTVWSANTDVVLYKGKTSELISTPFSEPLSEIADLSTTSNISKIDVGVVCQDSLGTLTNTNNNKTTYETAINKVNTLQKWLGIGEYQWKSSLNDKNFKPYSFIAKNDYSSVMTNLSLIVINGAGISTAALDTAADCLTWKLYLYLDNTPFATLMENGKLESYTMGRFNTGVSGISAEVRQGIVQLNISKNYLYDESLNIDKLRIFKDYPAPNTSNIGYIDYNALLENMYLVAEVVDTFGQKLTSKVPLVFDYREAPYFKDTTQLIKAKIYDTIGNNPWEVQLSDTSDIRKYIESHMLNTNDHIVFSLPQFQDPNGYQDGFTIVAERAIYKTYLDNNIPLSDLENIPSTNLKYETIGTKYISKSEYTNQLTDATKRIEIDIPALNNEKTYSCFFRFRIVDKTDELLSTEIKNFNKGIGKMGFTIPTLNIDDINYVPISANPTTELEFTISLNKYLGGTIEYNNIKYSSYNRKIILDNNSGLINNFKPKLQIWYKTKTTEYSRIIDDITISSNIYNINTNYDYSTLNNNYNYNVNTHVQQLLYFKFVLILPINSKSSENLIIECSDIAVTQEAPTISYRKNHLGINNKDFTDFQQAILVISEITNRNKIYLNSIDADNIIFDLKTGAISGKIYTKVENETLSIGGAWPSNIVE